MTVRTVVGQAALKEISKLAKAGALRQPDAQMAELLTEDSGRGEKSTGPEPAVPCRIEGVALRYGSEGQESKILRWELGFELDTDVFVGSLVLPSNPDAPPLLCFRERPGGRNLVGNIVIRTREREEGRERRAWGDDCANIPGQNEADDELEVDMIMDWWVPGMEMMQVLHAVRGALERCMGESKRETTEDENNEGSVEVQAPAMEAFDSDMEDDDVDEGLWTFEVVQDEEDDNFEACYEEAIDRDRQDSVPSSHAPWPRVSLKDECWARQHHPDVHVVLLPSTGRTKESSASIIAQLQEEGMAASVLEDWPTCAWMVVCVVDWGMVQAQHWESLKKGLSRGNSFVIPVSLAVHHAGGLPPEAPSWAAEMSWVRGGVTTSGKEVAARATEMCQDVAPQRGLAHHHNRVSKRQFVSYCWADSRMAGRLGLPLSLVLGNDYSDPRQIAAALGDSWIDVDHGEECCRAQGGVLGRVGKAMGDTKCTVLCVSDQYANTPRCIVEGWHALSLSPAGLRGCAAPVVVAVVGERGTSNLLGWEHTWLGIAVATAGCVSVDFREIGSRDGFQDAVRRLRKEIDRIEGRNSGVEATAPLVPWRHRCESGNQTGQIYSRPSLERLIATSNARGRGAQVRVMVKEDVMQCAASVSSDAKLELDGKDKKRRHKAKVQTKPLLKKGDICVILRNVREAVALVKVAPHKEKPFDLAFEEGDTIVVLRSVSADYGEGIYLGEINGTLGRVDAQKIRMLKDVAKQIKGGSHSHGRHAASQRPVQDSSSEASSKAKDRVWVRTPEGKEVCVYVSSLERLEEGFGGWEARGAMMLMERGDAWMLCGVGLNEGKTSAHQQKEEGEEEGSIHQSNRDCVVLLKEYRGAVRQALARAVHMGKVSRDEASKLAALERCKFCDFTAVLKKLPTLNYAAEAERQVLRETEEKALIAWCESTLSYLASLCSIYRRAGGKASMQNMFLVIDTTILEGHASHRTISLDVNSERDAGGVIVSYERHAWEGVLADIEKVVGEEGIVLERGDTGDVIATEEHWQAVFDLIVDDWHSKGKLGGEMRLVASTREPQSVRSSTSPVKSVGAGAYDMPAYFGEVTLLVNTLTMDDKRFGRWGKNGPERLKFRDARDIRNKKDASVRKKQEKVVVLRGMEKIERLDHLSQYLCNHFGKCVVLDWLPCDVTGKPTRLGEEKLTRGIVSDGAWKAAKKEVIDDFHVFRHLNGELRVDAYVDAQQKFMPAEGGNQRYPFV